MKRHGTERGRAASPTTKARPPARLKGTRTVPPALLVAEDVGTELSLANNNADQVAAPYKPTAREEEALAEWVSKTRARGPAPTFKVKIDGNKVALVADHPSPDIGQTLAFLALGSTDYDFLDGMISQIGNLTQRSDVSEYQRQLNFVFSVIRSIEPRDEIEAMLASQMATVQMAAMTFARRLAHVDNIPQQDSAERTYNKLMRTFTMQMDALKRYRATGQQVVVKHVTVNADQAVVADSVVNGAR